jgi:hypothetical protein
MNKIFYTLGFLLIFTLFNNEVKAQTSTDVVACDKTASGATIISNRLSSSDQTCDTSGATNLTLNIHSLGFCTSAPTVNFATGASAADERDDGTTGASDFSSCRWVITQSTASAESLESVGAIEPLPNDEIPPPGTYTHAVLVISNVMTITGSVTFDQTIMDTTGTATGNSTNLGLNGNEGTTCWTNGTYFIDTGKQGPLLGPTVADAAANKSAGTYKGGATCGSTPSPSANTVVSYYANYEPDDEDDPCSEILLGSSIRGCNTTRSEESTAFGILTLYYTVASSLETANPDIRRARILSTVDLPNGTATNTNTLTAVFAYNTPMVVTDKTTGMEIFVNFNNALNVDFEPIGIATQQELPGPDLITNTSSTNPPRIRSIQSGPFGIQFRSVEGGSTE